MRRCFVGALAAVATLALANAPSASAQEQLAASCEPPREDTIGYSVVGSLGNAALAQTFTSTVTGTLTRAEIDVTEDASNTGDYVIQLWSVNANGFPANSLATTTVADASVPTGDSLVNAVFTSPATVAAGTQYALVISRPTGTQLFVGYRTGNDCLGTLFLGDTTNFFNEACTGCDMVFRVYVTPTDSDGDGVPDAVDACVLIPAATANGCPPGVPVSPPLCRGQQATITGTENADSLSGTSGDDVIAGLGGNDKISGLSGKDTICGGDGNDKLTGGGGKDKLLGGSGKDTLKGGPGKDKLKGGPGKDKLLQ